MDPNETLNEIRDEVQRVLNDYDSDPVLLAERVQALDEWLSRGGFLPAAWTQGR